MLVVLPILAFAFLAAGFRRRKADWREALLYASIPWSLFLAFITEALTQFRQLTRAGVAFGWIGFAAVCLLWMWKSAQTATTERGEDSGLPLSWGERVALIAVAVIAAIAGLTALASAPNTWDAMEYHMPRVVEWINNRGVQFFPTIDWSQLCQPPFAEYTILHLHLLYGSDRLAAMVQWFAYVGSIVGVTLLAKELGGGRRAQIFAAVLCATLPSVVLGASSAKNDGVGAYWILLAVILLLRWRRSQGWPLTLAIGASLGLAAFTKGTAFVFLPFLVLACGMIWSGDARRRFLWRLPAIVALAACICLPLWVRNYQYTGSPLGFPYFYGVGDINGRMFGVAHVTPRETLANGIRNIALDAGVPSARANAFTTHVFTAVIRDLGVDPSDRGQIVASQLGYLPRFAVRFNYRNEVLTEDPVHMMLFLLAGVLFLAFRRSMEKSVGWLGLGLIGAFLLYSALLRWSPWNTRYQIPIFIVGAAFSAVVLCTALPRWATNSVAALVLLMALPLALANDTRPILTKHGLRGGILTTPRDETYFFDSHRQIAPSFIAAAAAARASGCGLFGLDANDRHYEYPMMAMLTEDGVPRKIRYVDVENSSVEYARPAAEPVCMVICLRCLHDAGKMAEYSAKFSRIQSFGDVVLFGPPPP